MSYSIKDILSIRIKSTTIWGLWGLPTGVVYAGGKDGSVLRLSADGGDGNGGDGNGDGSDGGDGNGDAGDGGNIDNGTDGDGNGTGTADDGNGDSDDDDDGCFIRTFKQSLSE